MSDAFLHVLLVLAIFWAIWSHFPLTAKVKRHRKLKEILRFLKHETRMNEDLYPEDLNAELLALRNETKKALKDKAIDLPSIEEKVDAVHKKIPRKKYADWGARIEGFVVVVAIAFAFRAVILQPFKIPTNSMRPTLHGINVYLEDDSKIKEFRENYLYPIYFGRAYFSNDVPVIGATEQLKDGRSFLIQKLFTRTFYTVGESEKNEFPGEMKQLGEAYQKWSSTETPEADEKMQGYVETGDNLFVNRYVYNLREPQRGDIAVFETKGIRQYDGSKLGGQFYIKRLAGTPGDTLKIDSNRDLYLRESGQTEFVKMDQIHRGFAKVMSKENGYNGYKRLDASERYRYMIALNNKIKPEENMGMNIWKLTTADATLFYKEDGFNRYLIKAEFSNGYKMEFTEDADIFTLGARQYFMLGDNSFNSLDSRSWGTVPRENFMGTACAVFWPFSKRWGWADK
ncbi:S26 family signal peptidase [Lentisphaera profundi]|uniref:Signal peptidase I n=1 Tax=Lentisphaera profundi TaxID=1658616 RepID=A0ABY7VRM7_9BACT|nr:S26 family signal peptidase [Lentisphaera profundi]WDE96855.1 S26 family signal peptidase [Lentisphaera profundi]